VEEGHPILSIVEQCDLLGLNRSSLYYEPRIADSINLELMDLIDQLHTHLPFYGYRKITHWLRTLDYEVNHKRILRLMKEMGIQALYAGKKPNLSAPGHKIYPYLLKRIEVVRPNQVWSVDITYIRMRAGFLYLVAIIDWFSRYVLSWKLSNSMDVSFCIEALDDALKIATPEIHNSDQGSQFGCPGYTDLLKAKCVAISMDGRGRAFDNIFIERLWRSVKYEEVYINDYANGMEAYSGLERYFTIYNNVRIHQALEYKTPYEIYFGKKSSVEFKIESRFSRAPHGGPWKLQTIADRSGVDLTPYFRRKAV